MGNEPTRSIVWFRRDLRLRANPAWAEAVHAARPTTALFVLDPRLLRTGAELRRRLLLGHLAELDAELRRRGGSLRVEPGDAADVVPRLATELDAQVFANLDTTPFARRRDDAVAAALGDRFTGHWGTLVHRPGGVLTKQGTLSRVFTPFHKQWAAVPWADLPTCPDDAAPPLADVTGAGVPDADGPPPELPGEAGAHERLAAFDAHADRYLDERDLPAIEGTSSLSADLRFGTLSPRFVATHIGTHTPGRAGFVRQLAWRDWYAHLLWDLPHLVDQPMKPEVGSVDWIDDPDELAAWQDGRTGIPIVDAGMRELRATGRMHNRVRMLCASFLVKNLLIDWRHGERWFRRLLIDADVSQNVGNWQWTAGTGPDAAPYFRIFNPVTQGRKFDADGAYVRRWVPELDGITGAAIHEPWTIGPLELAAAGVVLGDTYPAPLVDLGASRERALAAYAAARGERS